MNEHLDRKSHRAHPFFGYPGGKSRNPDVLNEIIYILKHMTSPAAEYREPFIGGGSVFLGMANWLRPNQRVWLNDKDSAIACLWMAVLKWPDELLRQSERMWFPSLNRLKELNAEIEQFVDPDAKSETVLRHAAAKLVVQHFNQNGGRNAGSKTKGASFGGVCKRLQTAHGVLHRFNVQITSIDCDDVITAKGNALIYCDPPYYENGPKCYRHFFTPEKHESFSHTILNCRNPWVLSYDDCPFIRGLYEVDERKNVYRNGRMFSETTKGRTAEILSQKCRSDMNRKFYGELLLTTHKTAAIAERRFCKSFGC